MYSRWTRDQEDVERLPPGLVRTAYDADRRQYTFLDTTSGDHYVSAPGEAYGTLVPAATAKFPKASRSSGRRSTLQAYDRPVFFADDMSSPQSKSPSTGHKRTPTMPPTSSRHHTSSTSGSTRKQGRKRSASFSDILPPHLIAPASNPSGYPAAASTATLAAPKPRRAGARGGSMIKSAPPTPPPYADEKKSSEWWSPSDSLLPSLPSQLPPPLPPKDYPASRSPQQQSPGGTWSPRVAIRLTGRVLGRTLGAVKGGQRSREGPSGDNGWVVV